MNKTNEQKTESLSNSDWLGPMYTPYEFGPKKIAPQEERTTLNTTKDTTIPKEDDNLIIISFSQGYKVFPVCVYCVLLTVELFPRAPGKTLLQKHISATRL